MNIRQVRFALLLGAFAILQACATAPGVPVDAGAAGGKQRVVIQVSDAEPAKWNLALNNANNMQDDIGAANVEIEIVAYGPGIGMLKSGAVTNSRIAEAMLRGIHVTACENTLRNMHLTHADLVDGLEYAPSGVVEIMKRQREGWAYIRP